MRIYIHTLPLKFYKTKKEKQEEHDIIVDTNCYLGIHIIKIDCTYICFKILIRYI